MYERQPWMALIPNVELEQASLYACSYNAMVNAGSDRGTRKMGDLRRALNRWDRLVGFAKLTWLQQQGVIEGFNPCPGECTARPGGLFHFAGCENDFNHRVSRARRDAAREQLPEHLTHAASVTLVG